MQKFTYCDILECCEHKPCRLHPVVQALHAFCERYLTAHKGNSVVPISKPDRYVLVYQDKVPKDYHLYTDIFYSEIDNDYMLHVECPDEWVEDGSLDGTGSGKYNKYTGLNFLEAFDLATEWTGGHKTTCGRLEGHLTCHDAFPRAGNVWHKWDPHRKFMSLHKMYANCAQSRQLAHEIREYTKHREKLDAPFYDANGKERKILLTEDWWRGNDGLARKPTGQETTKWRQNR